MNKKGIIRTIKRITIWTIVSLLVQLVVLSYFNYLYLPNKNKVNIVVVNPQEAAGSRQARIPADAENIKVSYNGKYAAYLHKNELCLIETKGSRIIKSFPSDGKVLSYYMWLPDRNIIIYSMGTWKEEGSVIEVNTYDADGDILRDYPELEVREIKSEVLEIALSPLTNIVYIKVGNNSKSSIYKFDIMDNLSFIMDVDFSTRIKKALYSDTLILQHRDLSLYIWDGGKLYPLNSPAEGKSIMLGLDGEDNIYLGEMNQEGKIFRIFAGKVDQEGVDSWNKIELLSQADADKIIISKHGEIYILDDKESPLKSIIKKNEHTIFNLTKKIKRAYKGDFIELIDWHIVSRKDRYLFIEEII